jgi:hypothetical protein
MKYSKISSDLQDSKLLFNYALRLEKGYLRTIDLCSAQKYFNISSDLGNSDAKYNSSIGL